jgi:hypothetical protein
MDYDGFLQQVRGIPQRRSRFLRIVRRARGGYQRISVDSSDFERRWSFNLSRRIHFRYRFLDD